MRSLRELIMGASQLGPRGISLRTQQESPTAMRAKCRIEVLSALNGEVLEVATRADTNHDWDIDLYIVRDDEALADAIATVLVLRGGK